MPGLPKSLPIADVAALALIASVCCAVPSFIVYSNWSELKQLKDAWTITGAPCPRVAAIPPKLISVKHPPKAFAYAGAGYVHASGLASCAELAEDPLWPSRGRFSVCQFNNPGAVSVQTATKRVAFLAPVGHRLTVKVRNNRAECVVGGWFSL